MTEITLTRPVFQNAIHVAALAAGLNADSQDRLRVWAKRASVCAVGTFGFAASACERQCPATQARLARAGLFGIMFDRIMRVADRDVSVVRIID